MQRKHLHALAFFAAGVGLVALFSPSHDAEATREITPPLLQESALAGETLNLPLQLPKLSSTESLGDEALPQKELPWQTITVRSGDNMSIIFDRLHISPQQLHAAMQADSQKRLLSHLRPGQQVQFQIRDNTLLGIRYELSAEKSYYVNRQGEEFSSQIVEQPLETRLTHASGVISTSLFQSGLDAGLSDNIIMELVNIFGWDVDFALDIRKGDRFSLLYEQYYLDGEKLRDGRILAAEFTNQDKTYQAVLFTDPNGRELYYSPDGRSMRKAFLRSPVDFRRISSKFQHERWHPVLGKKRPHNGVDYAAKTGTPIKAAGDGKVIFRGTKGGYGRTVIIQHGGNITTLYGHMSGYRSGVASGSRVRQGQIIGYVGASGMATGPHLHYEFRINGVHRNPLIVKLPNASPIPDAYQAAFQQQSRQLLAQIELFNNNQVAEASKP